MEQSSISQQQLQPQKLPKEQQSEQAQHSPEQKKESQKPSQEQPEQEITEETLQHFNKICLDASELMNSYKEQSEQLKTEITGIVTVYNENAGVGNAVPVEKIVEITTEYEKGMNQVQNQYSELSSQLRQEEQERTAIVDQITDCFSKLERMEGKIKEKMRLKQLQQKSKDQQQQQKPEDKQQKVKEAQGQKVESK